MTAGWTADRTAETETETGSETETEVGIAIPTEQAEGGVVEDDLPGMTTEVHGMTIGGGWRASGETALIATATTGAAVGDGGGRTRMTMTGGGAVRTTVVVMATATETAAAIGGGGPTAKIDLQTTAEIVAARGPAPARAQGIARHRPNGEHAAPASATPILIVTVAAGTCCGGFCAS